MPKLPYLTTLAAAKVSDVATPQPQSTPPKPKTSASNTPARPRQERGDSFNDPEADPWASPAVSKSQTRPVHNDSIPSQSDITAARPIMGNNTTRTTSAFTTYSDNPNGTGSKVTDSGSVGASSSGAGPAWGSMENSGGGFSNPLPEGIGGGFGPGGDDPNNPSGRASRAIGGGRTMGRGVEEFVSVTLLPEKEGMFMFQHRNYEVKSARRGSSVIRRYSDFVWLLDCLHKRYPFRQLPLLPPKRVAGR